MEIEIRRSATRAALHGPCWFHKLWAQKRTRIDRPAFFRPTASDRRRYELLPGWYFRV